MPGRARSATLWSAFYHYYTNTELKTLWRMTGTGDFSIWAVGPNGQVLHPLWGPELHYGSNWRRPGDEWGVGWMIPKQGLWVFHARRSEQGTGVVKVWLTDPVAGHAPPPWQDAQPYCGNQQPPCVPASLWRPLRIPRLDPGETCPVSRVVKHPPGSPYGRGSGEGPVYGPYEALSAFAVLLPPRPEQVDFRGSAWGGDKVLWHADPSYRGPVLIRGRQLDGTHPVRFERGVRPPVTMQFPATPGRGWRGWPSYTRIRAPGCYAWQVDGADFTELIFFRAVDANPR